MTRGNSLLYGGNPIKKEKDDQPTPVARIEDLDFDQQTLGLEEWIEADGWSGGHYWLARKESLPESWKEGGEKISKPNDFLSLIARAEAHLGALGKSDRLSFSDDFGGEDRAAPMRDVLLDGEKISYINSYYLEAALRLAGEPQRWHIVGLNGRNMIVGYSGEEPLIIIAPAR